ncbi:MAG TPA: ABC transporter ATP-binding protein [Candidatus Saccharimonadales bacterium]|nr:ABC transporter ATP-binding protein [Candidatus Saccharimonadales bacterium]
MAKQDNSSNKYSLPRNILRSLKLNWQVNRFALVGYGALVVLQVISSVLTIFFSSRIIGELTLAVQNRPVHLHRLYLWLGLSVISIMGERFAWRWLNFLERRSWIRWYVRMTLDFNSAVASLDMPQHHDNEFQKVLNKLTQQYQYIPTQFANYTLQLFHSTIRLMSSLVIVISFAPLLVPLLIFSLIPNFITERRLSKLQWSLWGEKGDNNRLAWRLTYYLQDKNKLQETKIFQTQKYLLNRLSSLHRDFYGRQIKNIQRMRWPAFGSLIVEGIVLLGVDLWLILRVVHHTLTLASFSFYSGIIFQFGSSLGLIVNSFAFLSDENEYMRDLFKMFDTKPALLQAAKPLKLDLAKQPTIEFRDVWFRYPNSDVWALQGVNFTLRPGEKIAFVGENGAGKTTIIRLLLRFYDADKGQILVNGKDVKELDLPSYYHHIGVLFQNFNDYPLSVRDNIAIGRVEQFANDSGVEEVAKQADADKFIQNYPKGYEQILEIGFKDGIEPSGGQWQRIALARALFRDADILILDEPTAAVDAKSEYAIFKTLEEHSKGKTTIVISHRFSTVRTAKQIYVLDGGKIVEAGSHAKLMDNKAGLYREMFEKQAAGYR